MTADAPSWADRTEDAVLDAALPMAQRLGWTAALVHQAGAAAGLSPADVDLLLPNGPRDLAALLSRRHDRAALASLDGIDPQGLKIRERIRRAAEARIEAAAADDPGVRRWTGFLALPTHAALGLKLAWESADALWRWAGDTATDENHYSKRAILSAVLLSTLAARLRGGREHAREHLAHRISQVMDFEKFKARLPKVGEKGEDLAAWLGRVRYGAQEKLKAHHEAQGHGPLPVLAGPEAKRPPPRQRGAEDHPNPPPDPFG